MRFFWGLFLVTSLLLANGFTYSPFIDKQIELTLKLSSDISDEEVEEILAKKEQLFLQKLEEVLANKSKYLHLNDPYAKKINRLQKIIAINKRRGNEYAVIRDEVLIKSYQVLQSQNRMLKEILRALDMKSFEDFSSYVNELFVKNQREINQINSVDYKPYLLITPSATVIKAMQNRIREYYAILEINADLLKTIVENERKMYRLNKYYRYGLIKAVLYINNTSIAKTFAPFLDQFHLSIVKLTLMVSVILLLLLFKRLFFILFQKIFTNLKFKNYVIKKIIKEIEKPIAILTYTIALNILFYIYNDFARTPFFSTVFDMIYVIVIMWSIYKVLNVIAVAKIASLTKRSTHLKSELINISIKIINFTLLLITILILMHLAGADLTTILSGLGIGGFAIALAAKDSLANFFGTLSILMSDTFSQGDWIVVDNVEGVVVEIGLRVTTIRTFDNALISIPNSKLANEAIKNWNKRKVGRRIKFIISLKYDSNPKALQKAMDAMKEFIASHPGVAKEEHSPKVLTYHDSAKLVSQNDALGIKNFQLVAIDKLAESSIDIMIYCFSASTAWAEWAKVKDEIIFGVMEIIKEHNLEFAYPSLSLYHEREVKVALESQAILAKA